jgi:hypothetical protein
VNYIGEFQKDSTILLELLTKDEENQSIPTDFPPTAVIEHYDRNGIVEVDNVTLETMEDGSRHTKIYQIPSHWNYGDYLITHRVFVDGVPYTTQEKFSLSRTKELVQESAGLIKAFATEPTQEEEVEEPVTSADGYIMPPDFQSPSTIEVVDNRIIVTLTETPKYNFTYRVVLNKEIRSMSGNRLGTTKTVTFTSEYGPMFATPLEVSSVLRGMYKYFTPHDIFGAIRDAGQKLHQMKGLVPDMNNSRYRAMRETDTAYFPSQKYVLYEASRALITTLMVRILNGADDEDIAGTGMISESGGSVTLGDFSVSDSSSSESGLGSGSNVKKEETPLEKLNALVREIEKELKFWQDAMMGHNRRGYAKPISGSYRTAAGSPEGRDFA